MLVVSCTADGSLPRVLDNGHFRRRNNMADQSWEIQFMALQLSHYGLRDVRIAHLSGDCEKQTSLTFLCAITRLSPINSPRANVDYL